MNDNLLEDSNTQVKLKRRASEILEIGTQASTPILSSIIDTVLGQIAPGAITGYYAYKQKTFERNAMAFFNEIRKRQEMLEELLSSKSTEFIAEIQDKYFGIITDYVVQEYQEQKIKYMVNGIINLTKHDEIKEDFVLFYYDILKDLRLVDISVLKLYYGHYDNYIEVLEENNIDYDQYNSVREKLTRMGLLETKHEKEMDNLYKNIIEIQNFLQELVKGKNKKLKRLDKLSKNDSYSISRFGRSFFEFFIESYKVESK